MKTGILLRTLLIEEQDTYEDSFAISESTVNKLSTRIMKTRSIVLNTEDTIISALTVDDKVEYHSKLLTIVPIDENTDEHEYELTERTKDILSEIKNRSPLAKVKGTINKIVIHYHCETNEIPKELKVLIEESDKALQLSTGNKNMTGKVNSSYSINGKSLNHGEIEIKYYIDTKVNMGLGDKAVLANQLKCTVGNVFPDTVRTKDNEKIDSKFSRRSISARVVNSADVISTANTVLVELSKQASDMYFND